MMIHSDQGSQFSSHDWQMFLKVHNLVPRMSGRGNCCDNAVAESLFQLLKRERKHGHTNMLPPAELERQYFMRQGAM